jgi:hypothetical protein
MNEEGSNYCGGCRLDLSLSTDEIKARDIIFETIQQFLKENPKYGIKELDRVSFDYAIEKNVGKFFMAALKAGLDKKEKVSEPVKEESMIEIEKEKLKILKEIKEAIKNKKSKV